LAKRIEVEVPGDSSYFLPLKAAGDLVRSGNGAWKKRDGQLYVVRTADKSKRGVWAPVQSGAYGPTVMQLT
jgi:hypothetical protein